VAQEDPSLVAYVVGAVAAGAVAVVGWVGKNTLGRIAALESGKVDKADFTTFMQQSEQHRRENREVQAKLFDKVDELKTIMLDRR
jgi:hypothetical protein